MKIVSGGQTGADQAALDAAISLGIEHGGWIPKGRLTESGSLPVKYKLKEIASSRYRERTERNIIDSDATLIFSFGPLTGGSALTEALAIKHNKPCLHIDFDAVAPHKALIAIKKWLLSNTIKTLNIAGPRASGEPRIYTAVYELLLKIDFI